MYNKNDYLKIKEIVELQSATTSPGVTLSSLVSSNIYGQAFTIESLTDNVNLTVGSGTSELRITGTLNATYPSKASGEEYYVSGDGNYQIVIYTAI